MSRLLPLVSALALLAPVGAASLAPVNDGDDETALPLNANDLPEVPLGTKVEPFGFVDSRYLPRTLDELGERAAYAIVFTAETCPISMRYQPVLAELEPEFRARGVQFLSVNVGPDDTLAGAAAQATESGIEFPVVKDFEGAIVKALGGRRTPEVVVLDAELVLRYRGRIDDAVRFGGIRTGEVRHYLPAVYARD